MEKRIGGIIAPVCQRLQRIHSGHVGDYVAWLGLGVMAFGISLAALI